MAGDEDDDEAVRVLSIQEDFGDTYVEVEAWSVPETKRYPDGMKYSMQYGTIDGDTILRYDNFPDHPDVDIHHRHQSDDPADVERVDYPGLESLYKRFKREVRDHGEPW
ncbi:toxin-antitoxin system TumE family protein [Natrinema caseinilyticum]|uniref:toxin-antitoxin system TumE family protein n=1 Tax=Natrinema caseinilyticum TaxID=2961570 RepID=UPI0020C41D33|nr:DUF6516 family protein [Natrinema caseinilyticum]